MTLETLVEEIRALPVEDRKQLIMVIVDSLTEPVPLPPRKKSLLELEGLGEEIWAGVNTDEYINQMRDEWDKHP